MAQIAIANQLPQKLDPIADDAFGGDFDPEAQLREIVVNPLFTPLSASAPVSITLDGNAIDEDFVAATVGQCLGDTFEVDAEKLVDQIMRATLDAWPDEDDHTSPVNSLLVSQSAARAGMPEPSSMVFYSADDIIEGARAYVQDTTPGRKDSTDMLLSDIAFYASPDTLGFAFLSHATFDAFKVWLDAQIQPLAQTLSPRVIQQFDTFIKSCDLSELTESLWLRKSAQDGNEPLSFARILVQKLKEYARDEMPDECAILPFSLSRLLIPESVVFVNVEAHLRSTPTTIADEWKLINRAIADDIRVMRPGEIKKLTAVARNAAALKKGAASAGSRKDSQLARAKNVKFRKTPPTKTDIVKLVSKVLARLAYVNHSQNVYKATKMSFARPNRRDPDDYNRQGKVVSTRYRPDIHLYVDTSGSISETQYQDAVKACISLARKLDVNLYFNSFSHVMSTSTLLATKGQSSSQIWRQIQKVPKVQGGTDYAQIWRYIDSSKRRRRELSLIITDFEYSPPNRRVTHPKNIYYLPISVSNWSYLVMSASRFSQSMEHIFPDIRSHVLL